MRGIAIGVKFSVLQLLVEQFALPDGMSVILYIVDQQCRQGKSTEALDITANRSIHH